MRECASSIFGASEAYAHCRGGYYRAPPVLLVSKSHRDGAILLGAQYTWRKGGGVVARQNALARGPYVALWLLQWIPNSGP